MKRILSLLFMIILLLTACGRPDPAPQPRLAEEVTLTRLVDDWVEQYRLPLPAVLDDDLMTRLIGIPAEDRVDYRGYFSMDAQSPDQIIGVQAAQGRAEQVAKQLEVRRAFVVSSLEGGQPRPYQKARCGRVVFRGDYVFLIIAGRPDSDPVAEVAEITQLLQEAFAG